MIDEEKQMIDEMAREIAKRDCYLYEKCPKPIKHNCVSQDPAIMMESSKHYVTTAIWLVNAGYRKERQGEWVKVYQNKMATVYECSCCKHLTFGTSDYCICGARMKGEKIW